MKHVGEAVKKYAHEYTRLMPEVSEGGQAAGRSVGGRSLARSQNVQNTGALVGVSPPLKTYHYQIMSIDRF